MNVADFTFYPKMDRARLVELLASVCAELYNAHVIYGAMLGQERSARVQAFLQSQETSVAGRERDADAQALHITVELYRTQSQIKALTEERDLLTLLLSADPA